MNRTSTRSTGRTTLTRTSLGVLAAGLVASAAYGFGGPAQAAPPAGDAPAATAAVGTTLDGHRDWPDLRRGSKGLDVEVVQRLLTERGYPTKVDGRYGAHTASKVLAFQKANRRPQTGMMGDGLRPTGVMDDDTFERLLPLVSRGARGQEVRAIQRLLNRTGHRLRVDGVFGPRTQAAVRAWQAETGLARDGVVGHGTWFTLMWPDAHRGGH
jgi:peptidoglycan hydrolase-like protein with peptidoglycan-binding domain